MNKTLVIWNVAVTVILLAVLGVKLSSASVRAAGAQEIRVNRLELVDRGGKTRAVLETDGYSSAPKLIFYNDAGREAVILTVNSKGYGTMFFQDKKTDGKASIGYLVGGDTPTRGEDPLSAWGMRVIVGDGDGHDLRFGVLNDGQLLIPVRK